jgi:hypothetical protein
MERARKLGLVWTAPVLNAFVPAYLERKQAMAA